MLTFFRKFFKGFVYAFNGIVSGFSERNMRVHGLASSAVIGLSAWLQLSVSEWAIILVLIGAVMSAELFNTAIEELANTLRDELHLSYAATRRARDTAAGAVLVLAVIAATVGLLILGPKLIAQLLR